MKHKKYITVNECGRVTTPLPPAPSLQGRWSIRHVPIIDTALLVSKSLHSEFLKYSAYRRGIYDETH